jgi:asparagine synthase (glutamine-hydrolysing)
MMAVLTHRGPDAGGVWNEGAVGLGHRMLRTTPESPWESFPLKSRSGILALVADVRIDNRDELLATLHVATRSPGGICDGEIILAAYEAWKLIGDFAFAIWDKRRQKLFLARDHFGVKPLYYCLFGQGFAFASEIKALLCLPWVPRQLNEVRVSPRCLTIRRSRSTSTFSDCRPPIT